MQLIIKCSSELASCVFGVPVFLSGIGDIWKFLFFNYNWNLHVMLDGNIKSNVKFNLIMGVA